MNMKPQKLAALCFLPSVFVAAMLAGCSDESKNAAAISLFVRECNVPVSGKLVLGSFGTTLEFSCAEFKPDPKSK
jgi:ABC-type uncharacterized transport system auxiliary subunit